MNFGVVARLSQPCVRRHSTSLNHDHRSPLNEPSEAQRGFDFRTGLSTFITGPAVGRAERIACGDLNRLRARRIMDASKIPPPGKSPSIDVWSAVIARRTSEWEVPLIPLSKLGISRTPEEGFIQAEFLMSLGSGQEAYAYLDEHFGVVYKLFDLREGGALGKKVEFRQIADDEFDLAYTSASLSDTLEKIAVLHDLGAHPTEIVGLAESGDFLIVKQPAATPRSYSSVFGQLNDVQMLEFEQDREAAIRAIKGVACVCPGVRQTTAVCELHGQSWFVTDLHNRNIMFGGDGGPTIIDALIGAVPVGAIELYCTLGDTVRRARDWRVTGKLRRAQGFDECHDSDL